MPTYSVQGPDGKIYDVEGPAGATAEQLGAFIQQNAASFKPAAESAPAGPSSPKTSRLESIGEGVLMGLRDPVDAGAQMLRRAVPDAIGNAVDQFGNYLHGLGLPVAASNGVQGIDDIVNRANAQYQAARDASGRSGFDVPRMLGQMAAVTPALAVAPAAPASLLGRIGTGAAEGALLGMTNPVIGQDAQQNFGAQKAGQATTGSLLGAATSPITGLLSRLVSPKMSQPGTQAGLLRSEGVELTPGQIAGGAMMRTEDKLMSAPILGDAIRSARTRANDQFNRAVYNRVLAPIGQTTERTGRAAVEDVSSKISSAYDDVLSNVQFAPDNAFQQSLANLSSMAASLPAREAGRFNQIVNREVMGPLSKGQSIDGLTFKDIERQLGTQAQRLHRSTDAYQQDLGDAVGEVQRALRESLIRQNPQAARTLQQVNQAFAMLTRLQTAAAKTGATDGVFTPAQFSQAVRQGDRTVRKNAFARGNALMQDLADAGKSVMSSTVPNSGTTDRLLLNAGALGAAAVNPAIPASLLGASALYLPGASRALPFLMTARPAGAQQAASLLRRAPVGLLGTLAGQL